jgi:5-methylcytosine-specific restriction endonuclease McrA
LILDMIERGELHLTGAARCAPQLDEENHRELLAAVAHKTKREIEEILAARFPQPDLPDAVYPVASDDKRTTIDPLAADRFAICFTGSRRCRELLEKAKELSSHRKPRPGIGDLLECALDAYVEKLEKQKFKTTDRPRKPRANRTEDPRHIPADVMRAVYERDGGRCTFVGKDGRRCCARAFLEYDHIVPVAHGGESTVENLRLLCSTHNQHAARCTMTDPHAYLMASGFRPVRRSKREAIAAAVDVLRWTGARARASESTRAGTSEPTRTRTSEPTRAGTSEPTRTGTSEPTRAGTSEPTRAGTSSPRRAGEGAWGL